MNKELAKNFFSCKNIGIDLGGREILRNINIDIKPGEVLGIIGPNGAGKTSLIEILSGRYKQKTGDVIYKDQIINNKPLYERARMGIGRTYQTPVVPEELTVGETLKAARQSTKPYLPVTDAEYAADLVKFKVNWDTANTELETFNRRKLLMTSVLMREPDIILMDEPASGLINAEIDEIDNTLRMLSKEMNIAVLIVEHRIELLETIADRVVVMDAGEIIAEGTPDDIKQNENSITGKYLTGIEYIAIPEERRKARENRAISIINAHSNNLKNITCSIPIGLFTAVTGVSGGGKSTLIIQTLYKALAKKLNGAKAKPGLHDEIKGTQYIDKIIEIDQSPIGRTPRSNPATYTGAFTAIRDWYVGLPESKARGYKAGRFSFNVKGGRCENCQGDGLIKIEMHFLPDVYVICDTCKGARYNKETIEIKYRGKSIADILNMTVEEALLFFRKMPLIRDKFEALYEVGLGYMKIGQSATTLSGGEAQRVKLAKELCKKATGRTLYILDEPTTGLHSNDIKKLLKVLHRLVESGNTVLVIEHNMDVIKTADWIVDIGPKGGDKGGIIVAEGTPEEVANVKESITGHYLTKYLNKAKKIKKSA